MSWGRHCQRAQQIVCTTRFACRIWRPPPFWKQGVELLKGKGKPDDLPSQLSEDVDEILVHKNRLQGPQSSNILTFSFTSFVFKTSITWILEALHEMIVLDNRLQGPGHWTRWNSRSRKSSSRLKSRTFSSPFMKFSFTKILSKAKIIEHLVILVHKHRHSDSHDAICRDSPWNSCSRKLSARIRSSNILKFSFTRLASKKKFSFTKTVFRASIVEHLEILVHELRLQDIDHVNFRGPSWNYRSWQSSPRPRPLNTLKFSFTEIVFRT